MENKTLKIKDLIKYYEDAYSKTLKLINVQEKPSELLNEHLFSAANYYKDKINKLKKELNNHE